MRVWLTYRELPLFLSFDWKPLPANASHKSTAVFNRYRFQLTYIHTYIHSWHFCFFPLCHSPASTPHSPLHRTANALRVIVRQLQSWPIVRSIRVAVGLFDSELAMLKHSQLATITTLTCNHRVKSENKSIWFNNANHFIIIIIVAGHT